MDHSLWLTQNKCIAAVDWFRLLTIADVSEWKFPYEAYVFGYACHIAVTMVDREPVHGAVWQQELQ